MKHTYQTADVILIIVGSCQPFKFCYSVLLEIGNHIGRGPSTPAVIKQILTIGLNENRKPLPHIQHCQGKGCPIFTV